MGSEETPQVQGSGLREGGRFILILGSFVIVIAGIMAARSFLVPLLLSAFIACLCWPAIRRLQRWGAPPWLAITLVLLGLILALFLVSGIIGNSVSEFSAKVDEYDHRLDEIVDNAVAWFEARGVEDLNRERLQEMIDARNLLQLVVSTVAGILGALSNFIVILLIAVFMLIEAEGLPRKLRRIEGDPDADLSNYSAVTQAINDFIRVKTISSIITAVTISTFLIIVGVDYPLLWGLLAFLFNYIPQIGSIIAAIPAVLLTLITKDASSALIVAVGYLSLNALIGSVIEPRMMGKQLGLSFFVIILSLIFWNWVLGPVGMLLSIPLTMIVKILLEHSEDLKPIAILLGPSEE
jgi:predicted PurR-regulated permease PerM